MTHDDALDLLASHPHARRYRELCDDDSDPERREAMRGLVVRLARGDDPAPPAPVAVSYGDPAPAAPCGHCP